MERAVLAPDDADLPLVCLSQSKVWAPGKRGLSWAWAYLPSFLPSNGSLAVASDGVEPQSGPPTP